MKRAYEATIEHEGTEYNVLVFGSNTKDAQITHGYFEELEDDEIREQILDHVRKNWDSIFDLDKIKTPFVY